MTPDELVVMLLERLAKSKVDCNVDNYNTTRAAAERLVRTPGPIPTEPPKQSEMSPAPLHSTPRCQNCNHIHYHHEPCVRPRRPVSAFDSDPQIIPVCRPGRRGVHVPRGR